MLELNRNKIDEVSGGIGVAVAIAVALIATALGLGYTCDNSGCTVVIGKVVG